MAITVTNVTDYNTDKATFISEVSTISTSIVIGDTLAYHNLKDDMYYFVKVKQKNIVGNDVTLQVYGTRFMTDTTINMSQLIGQTAVSGTMDYCVCGNGKNTAWQTFCPNVKIKYCEIFLKTQPFTITGLFHNSTMDVSDDIENLIVLGAVPNSSGNDYYINNRFTGGDSGGDGAVAHGMARHIALNFKNMVN